MFGVSIPEILLVCVVILVVLGPERLPDATRKVARLLGQFRRQADSIRRELYNSMYIPADDIRNDIAQVKQNLKAVKQEVANFVPLSPEELLTCEDKARIEAEKKQKALEASEESETNGASLSEEESPENSTKGESQ